MPSSTNRMGVVVTGRASTLSPEMVGCHPQRHIVSVVSTRDRAWLGAIPKAQCAYRPDTRPHTAEHHPQRHIVLVVPTQDHTRLGVIPKTHCAAAKTNRPIGVRYLHTGVKRPTRMRCTAFAIAHGHEITDANRMFGVRYWTRVCNTRRRPGIQHPALHMDTKQPAQTGYSVPGITCVNRKPVTVAISCVGLYTHVWENGHRPDIRRPVLHGKVGNQSQSVYATAGLRTGVEQRSRTRCPASGITHAYETTVTDRGPGVRYHTGRPRTGRRWCTPRQVVRTGVEYGSRKPSSAAGFTQSRETPAPVHPSSRWATASSASR